jgi:hypothetical protein
MMIKSHFVEILVAALGGLLVGIGLLMEHFGDNKEWYEYKFLTETRRKSVKYIGEWFVIIGVGIEVAVAAITAEGERQMRQMVIKNDPKNLPIVSIIGRVSLVLQQPFDGFAANLNLPKKYIEPSLYSGSDRLPSTFPFLLSDDKELQKHEMVFLQFGKQTGESYDSEIPAIGQISAMVDIVSDSKTNSDDLGFEINLYPPADGSPVFNPNSVTFNELKYVHFSMRSSVPPPLKVVSGKIDLLINGFFPKSFLIRPQTNDNLLNVFAFETNGVSEN